MDALGSRACLDRLQTLELGSDAKQIELLQAFCKVLNAEMRRHYDARMPIRDLVSFRSKQIDRMLVLLWKRQAMDPSLGLLAVGGYGRGELHPHSDIDLMVLVADQSRRGVAEKIRDFLTLLWDMKLDVGHSVRTVGECWREAEQDVTIATNLMESRLLCGDSALYRDMMKCIGSRRLWSSRSFFSAKYQEQLQRHRKFADTAHNVEPHVKEGPGGLRDIQVIGWVAKRHFGVARLHELVDKSFLTEQEYQILRQGRELLWRIRYGLHLLRGRREDRLLFDYQKTLASQFGYCGQGNRAVESFMKEYYNTVRVLRCLNEMLLQHFAEEIVFARRKEMIVPVNSRFQIHHGFIEVVDEQLFVRHPFSLLEIFLLIQQHPEIKGVRASTVRLLRKHTDSIDASFRTDMRARSCFLKIMSQVHHAGHELRRMHRYGVLAAYLPVFARIQGLMQFDLFHAYTVDEHILFVIGNLHRFSLPEYRDEFPLCCEVMSKIPKQEVLYIAALFHDIAKGRDGDHSELGEREADQFCIEHDLGVYDARMVSWLVKHHLLMSKTAHRMDIHDPASVDWFAGQVADCNHLDHLYLLTVADIRATHPDLWNQWKASLLDTLYHNTLLALRRGKARPLFKRKLVQENQVLALNLIPDAEGRRALIEQFWKTLHMEYFFRHSAAEIAWHTDGVLQCKKAAGPLVLVDRNPDKGWTQIFVYTHDRAGIFAATAQGLEQLQLNVLDARILTSKSGYTLDTYVVMEKTTSDSGQGYYARPVADIVRCIQDRIMCKSGTPEVRKGVSMQDRRLKNFSILTRVDFFRDAGQLSMEVITMDRPGVLSRIGQAIDQCKVQIDGAKIATYGERAEDIFFISQRTDGSAGIDQGLLKQRIIATLG